MTGRLARWRTPLKRGVWWSTVTLSVAGLGGMFWVPLAIASHFQYVYAPVWLAILALSVLPSIRRKLQHPLRLRAFAAAGAVLHGLAVASLYHAEERPVFPHAAELDLVWFNLHNSHESLASLREHIKDDSPDLLAFAEAQFVDIEVPPSYEHMVRSKWGGVVLYSRLPIDNAKIHDVEYGRGVLEVDVLVNGARLRVFVAHPFKPGTGEHTREFRHLSSQVKRAAQETEQLVVVGDLNQTRWSALFKELIRAGRLHPACEGRGLSFTWGPVNGFPLGLGIDHVLVGEQVEVRSFEVLPWLDGSDHRALRARLAVPTPLMEDGA